MTEQFSNFAVSSLSAPLTARQTTINVASAINFPKQGNFRLVVQSFDATTNIPTSGAEIMLATAVSGNSFTVTRGAENTAAIAFASGAQVAHIITAGVMQALVSGGGGITSINADTTAAQIITGGTGISVSTSAGTTTISATGAGSGTVTSVSVATANGVSGTVANPTTTPAITIALGAITPTSVAASGTIGGSNFSGSSSGSNTGDQTSVSGNAGTATALQTARAINGVNFDGTAPITVAAAAGTLTGTTLAAGVTASSLTSVGTLVNLIVTNPISGSVTGNAATVTTNANLTGPITSSGNATSIASQTGTGSTFAMSASPTFTGTVTEAASVQTGIRYMNGGTLEEAVFSNGNSGTTKAINLDNGNLQSITITGAVAITQTTPTHPGKYTLVVTQDGTGHVYSLSGVKFPGGTPPTYSTAAGKIDVISIIYDGTNYYGMGGIAFS